MVCPLVLTVVIGSRSRGSWATAVLTVGDNRALSYARSSVLVSPRQNMRLHFPEIILREGCLRRRRSREQALSLGERARGSLCVKLCHHITYALQR